MVIKMEKKERAGTYRMLWIVAVLLIGVFVIFWKTSDKMIIHAVSYSDAWQEEQELSLEEGMTLQLKFQTQQDEINGFLFYYSKNEENYGENAKLTLELSEQGSGKSLAQKEVLLAAQISGTSLYVNCPVTGVKEKELVLKISCEGLEDEKAPALGLASSEEASYQLEVNQKEHFPVYFLMYYPVRQSGLTEALIKTLCTAVGAGLLFYMYATGQIVKKTKREKKKQKKEKKKPSGKQVLCCAVAVLGMLLCVEFTWSHTVKPATKKQAEKVLVYTEDNCRREMPEGEAYTQIINVAENQWKGLKIELAEEPQEASQLRIAILDESKKLFEETYDIKELVKKQEDTISVKLKFSRALKNTKGKNLTVVWNMEKGSMKVRTDEKQQIGCSGYFSVYGGLKKFFFAIMLFSIIHALILLYGAMIGKWNPDKLFLLAVLGWGLVYSMLLPVYTIPDEPSHVDTAYRVSNEILGVKDNGIGSTLYRRYDDIDIDAMEKTEVTAESYREVYETLFTKVKNKTLTESYSRNNLGNVPKVFYLPQAVGLSVGRLSGAGRTLTYLLGRVFNLLAAALLMYCGVRKLPFGKSVFYVIGLLPITLQEVMSFSYDAFLIGISFLFAGYLLRWIYGEGQMEVPEMAVLLVATILLGLAKAGAYLPLTILLIAAVYRKKTENSRQGKRTALWLAGSIGFCYMVQYPNILMRTGFVAKAAAKASAVTENCQITTLLKNPGFLLRILENTVVEKADIYLKGILGGKLGWLNIDIPWHICMAFLILLLLAAIPGKEEHYIRKGYQKLGIWSVCILSSGMIFASMLIASTPAGTGYIAGVQGRYFLPFLGILMLTVSNGKIRNEGKKEENYVSGAGILQILVVLQIVMNVL